MAYYFVDRSLIRVYSLTRNAEFLTFDNRTTHFQFTLIVKQDGYHQHFRLTINNVTRSLHDNRAFYDLTSVNAFFNLTHALWSQYNVSVSRIDNFRIKLFIIDLTRNLSNL